MKLLLVGHGKMGRMVESIARDYGFEVAGVIDPMSAAHGGSADAAAWSGVDVAIDFSTADSVPVNAPVLARRGINLVVGTTGWSAREAEVRTAVADSGAGVVVAPNFSTGVVLFEAIAAHAAQLFATQDEFGAFVHVDGPAETITLSHAARDRTAFARGALAAAKWIHGKRGWYTMRDVLGLTRGAGGLS
ncbi:MAG: hypothetical protein JF610_13475 [Acidobacteria bacterium]|nr:hypothetical protein [Acidobacteriota bacterium]